MDCKTIHSKCFMKKLILICALLMGSSTFVVPSINAQGPLCTLEDPCLYEGFAEGEHEDIWIKVKKNSKGQIVALVAKDDYQKGYLCQRIGFSNKYCFTYLSQKFYFKLK